MPKLAVYADGASKGNPGPAGIGVVLVDAGGTVLREIAEYVGHATNNAAEYLALIRGLEAALELGADSVEINVDSELMARQLAGVYRVKSRNLAPLYERAVSILRRFRGVTITHVLREFNKRADRLANEAVRNHQAHLHVS